MNTAQKMKFSIKDFFSKCDKIRSLLRMWLHLLKKSLMENFIFCAVGHISFICQRHYAQILIHEPGLNNMIFIISTYMRAGKPVDKTVSDSTSFLKDKFNFKVLLR